MTEDVYERLLQRLPEIAKAVKVFDNAAVQERAFDALTRALGVPGDTQEGGDGKAGVRRRGMSAKRVARRPDRTHGHDMPSVQKAIRSSRGRKTAVTAEKGLDFRPKGEESFKDFAAAKAPDSFNARNAVCIYYLKEIMKIDTVGVGHVLAAFREAGWKPASNPKNSLQVTAHREGWIDTADMDNIGLMPSGVHFVEHELPKARKKGK